MEMTTPVFSTPAGPDGSAKMSFVMERRYGNDPSVLPAPNSTKVERKVRLTHPLWQDSTLGACFRAAQLR